MARVNELKWQGWYWSQKHYSTHQLNCQNEEALKYAKAIKVITIIVIGVVYASGLVIGRLDWFLYICMDVHLKETVGLSLCPRLAL